ncbi:hypothetical protein ACFQH8_18445 [Halomicroarcula sp. GCM10025710]
MKLLGAASRLVSRSSGVGLPTGPTARRRTVARRRRTSRARDGRLRGWQFLVEPPLETVGRRWRRVGPLLDLLVD